MGAFKKAYENFKKVMGSSARARRMADKARANLDLEKAFDAMREILESDAQLDPEDEEALDELDAWSTSPP